jgi:hypothetical protein
MDKGAAQVEHLHVWGPEFNLQYHKKFLPKVSRSSYT